MGDILYQMIMLDYGLYSLRPYLTYEVLNVHYNDIYYKIVSRLNSLLESQDYHYNYMPSQLVSKIDIFPLMVRGEILYYLGAFLNHNLYFSNISNRGNIVPIGKIKRDIERDFTTYASFKEKFIASSMNLVGSGYTFLVLDNGKLKIINTSNEDTPYSYKFIPVICLDLWEHAYFLEYKNNKLGYINNFFQIIDFQKINNYYEKL